MTTLSDAKGVVRAHNAALDQAQGDAITDVLTRAITDAYRWRGYYPFEELTGAAEVAARFWQPFRHAITRMQRREDVFFAGVNGLSDDPGVWVVSMGHLMGCLTPLGWAFVPPARWSACDTANSTAWWMARSPRRRCISISRI